MAIINLTPDSFFDGGHLMPEEGQGPNLSVACRRALGLREQGASILDLGGESTRPGAAPVSPEDEARRVLPVIARLRELGVDVPLSVDTRRAAVARAAIAAGASIINDVSGLADPEMAAVAAESGAGLVISHLRGEPATMQEVIAFSRLFDEVASELAARVEQALAAGVDRAQIVVDPGVGFGKDADQSAALTAASRELEAATGCPVLIGASRKSFLGAITGRPVEGREAASVVAALVAIDAGASIVRVHDVQATVEALRVASAIREAHARHGGGAARS
ncbi:MAG: dihydropteroate synthase [Myxococcales bacterium]|nr:dihydropteroate synthase [Myxococcales bacterium]